MVNNIKKGDWFICTQDYVMDDDTIAYTEGSLYSSALNGCVTDNISDQGHGMEREKDFNEYFQKIHDIVKQPTVIVASQNDIILLDKYAVKEADIIIQIDENKVCKIIKSNYKFEEKDGKIVSY